MGEKTLLFLHGINDDDSDGSWLEALEVALRRDGSETLTDRGFKVLAPSYLALLAGEEPAEDILPRYTRVRDSEQEERESAGRYWLRQAELERAIAGVPRPSPGPLAVVPPTLAEVLVPYVFGQAHRYRNSAARRHAIYRHLLEQLPTEGDLVVVAHSLGSVVAADLLYHLPPQVRVKLLVTIGSPLSLELLRRHLRRLKESFPYSTVESWLNVIGHHDPVTTSRGMAASFPEALDVFVDNGIGEDVHSAQRYLDQEVIVRALNWVDQVPGTDVGRADQPLSEPLLAVVAGAQFALRLEQAQEPGARRTRFGAARALVAEEITMGLREAGLEHPVLSRLLRDNSEVLRGRLTPPDLLPLLLTASTGNAIAPYVIAIEGKVRRTALANFAGDLGVPSVWAEIAWNSMREARAAHRSFDWKRAAVAAAGVVVVIAAPALVFAVAPAALAGGAAVVGGLAALGPGGMLGGLAVVGVVGGMGGTVAASALTTGSSQVVQKNLIFIQALALGRGRLQISVAGHPEWYTLVAMESQVAAEHARLSQVSDSDSPPVKEAETKLAAVKKALRWMVERDLGPEAIGASTPPAED